MTTTTGDLFVDALLTNNGFGGLIGNFRDHAVRRDVLADLTDEDLQEIGVTSLGHRIRLLKLATASRSSSLSNTLASQRSLPRKQGVEQSSYEVGTVNQLEDTIAKLQQQLEDNSRQQAEQITKLRTWFSRKLKEMAPLPTPASSHSSRQKAISPGTVAQDSYFTHMAHGGNSAHSLHKRSNRSPQAAHFSQNARSSPTTPLSPPALPPARSSIVLQQYSHNGTMVLGAQNEPHNKSMKVSPEDRTPKVLATALYTFLDVKDSLNWRLCFHCRSVDKLYELKDEQFPQRVYRELIEQGLDPVLVMNHVPPARQSQPNML